MSGIASGSVALRLGCHTRIGRLHDSHRVNAIPVKLTFERLPFAQSESHHAQGAVPHTRAGDSRILRGWSVRSLLASVATLAVVAATTSATARPADQSCDATLTRTTWVRFLDAYNRGGYDDLDALFARKPGFLWYSSNVPGLRNLTAATNRLALIPYFRARHARHDRMRLLSFAYHENSNFTYRLRRSASDYRGGRWFRLIGKGAVTCVGVAVRLIVVSIGGPGSG